MVTETVVVLFTDVVGSTDLLSRVGEARADELRREVFDLSRAAISAATERVLQAADSSNRRAISKRRMSLVPSPMAINGASR